MEILDSFEFHLLLACYLQLQYIFFFILFKCSDINFVSYLVDFQLFELSTLNADAQSSLGTRLFFSQLHLKFVPFQPPKSHKSYLSFGRCFHKAFSYTSSRLKPQLLSIP
mmetsp:Transcript_29846/g.35197  ORF Transcript_29846/g.35197 Transcript_29846/m.35197 type:complete len:110 (-) Transcript_29846:343-672(-)